ncbi:hypothetical protein AB4Z43_28525 [Mesorhizobium sp. 2RAF45]
MRAFSRTFGMPPHQYVLDSRKGCLPTAAWRSPISPIWPDFHARAILPR